MSGEARDEARAASDTVLATFEMGEEDWTGALTIEVGDLGRGDAMRIQVAGRNSSLGTRSSLSGTLFFDQSEFTFDSESGGGVTAQPITEYEWIFGTPSAIAIGGPSNIYHVKSINLTMSEDLLFVADLECIRDSEVNHSDRTIPEEAIEIMHIAGQAAVNCVAVQPGGEVLEDPMGTTSPLCRQLLGL
jgi:hypothetical protein